MPPETCGDGTACDRRENLVARHRRGSRGARRRPVPRSRKYRDARNGNRWTARVPQRDGATGYQGRVGGVNRGPKAHRLGASPKAWNPTDHHAKRRTNHARLPPAENTAAEERSGRRMPRDRPRRFQAAGQDVARDVARIFPAKNSSIFTELYDVGQV